MVAVVREMELLCGGEGEGEGEGEWKMAFGYWVSRQTLESIDTNKKKLENNTC